MDKLPTAGLWQAVSLADEEVLLWSSTDLKCCFYIYLLPKAWWRYMIFNKPIASTELGLKPSRQVYLCSK
eukprot:3827757-Karenia_brevis.AAC.1